MRTFWTLLVAIVVGFIAQAQQQVNNFRVLTNLYVGNAITGVTLNGYNIDAIATNSAANKLDITNGTAVNLTGSLSNVTLDGATLTQPFAYNAGRSSGTNAYFNAGKITFPDGQVLTWAGGSVACIASRTNFVGINLWTGTLHALRAGIDHGTAFIATVVCDGSSITSVSQNEVRLAHDRLVKFKHAIQNTNHSQTLVRIGNSIMRGTYDATNRWMDQLFLSTATVTNNLLPNMEYLTSTHLDYGGQKSSEALMWLGRGVTSKVFNQTNHSSGLFFGDDFAANYPSYGARVYRTKAAQAPNLAVITDYFNGGRENWLLLFETVKALRAQGCEVILTTDNEPRDSTTDIWDNYGQWLAIADATGACLSDTRSYLEEAQRKGETVHFDGSHPNWYGAQLYAECVRGALTYFTSPDTTAAPLLANRTVAFDNPTYWTNGTWPQRADFTLAAATTGSYGPTTIATNSEYYNVIPSVLLGGKTHSEAILELEVGEWAIFTHPFAKSGKLIVERITADRYYMNAETLRGNAFVSNFGPSLDTASAVSTYEFVLGEYMSGSSLSWSDPTGFESGASPFRNIGFKVTSVTNTTRLIGVIWDTVPWQEIPRSAMVYDGLWTLDGYDDLPDMPVSDTIGSRYSFEFEGTGALLVLAAHNAAGRIDVWLDGELIYDNHNLYDTPTALYTRVLPLLPGNLAWGQSAAAYGKHTVRVELVSVTGIADPVSFGKRRLMPLAAFAIDTR